jgi:tetratricopeptide (TPR) repeat protein
MRTIRKYISNSNFLNQPELIEKLFGSLISNTDEGQISKWINNHIRVSKEIAAYYTSSKQNRDKLSANIEKNIVDYFYDRDMAMRELRELVVYDMSVSEDKKQELCEAYSCESNSSIADFICIVLVFAMDRHFDNQLAATPESTSPMAKGQILKANVPSPCNHFCGRENEIAKLHELLAKNTKVFIHGNPGIGKSEFAKAYAKNHKSDYKQILYFPYRDTLENTIAEIKFVGDSVFSRETQCERFERHDNFLRALNADTLIIIDNFNTTVSDEELLGEIINYDCRIIFTTRSRFDEYTTCEHIEIQDFSALFSIVGHFYGNANSEKEIVGEIINAVHSHTMSVVMAAQILECGIHAPATVRDKLIEGYGIVDSGDKISVQKDGKSKKATHERHIETLFTLHDLSEQEQNVMRNMAFIPLDGIEPRMFAMWLNLPNMNAINDLTELGFIQKSDGKIKLHSLIRDISTRLLKPTVSNCETLIDSLCDYCKRDDIADYSLPFQIVENIIKVITNDSFVKYYAFIVEIYPYMHRAKYEHGMGMILDELDKLDLTENNDRATLFHFQALYKEAINADPQTALDLERMALEYCEDTALNFKINAVMGYIYYHFGNRELAEQHYRNAFGSCNRKIDCGKDLSDIIDATWQYINLILDSERMPEALEILERWIVKITEQFGAMCSPYADMIFYKGIVYFKSDGSENTKSGWRCFHEAVRVYNYVYENNAEQLQAKIELVKSIIKSFNLSPPPPDFPDLPDLPDLKERITTKTAELV